MRFQTEVYGHRKTVCTESWLWEKNPLPHRGIEPASAACRSDALLAELYPQPVSSLSLYDEGTCIRNSESQPTSDWRNCVSLRFDHRCWLGIKCKESISSAMFRPHVTYPVDWALKFNEGPIFSSLSSWVSYKALCAFWRAGYCFNLAVSLVWVFSLLTAICGLYLLNIAALYGNVEKFVFFSRECMPMVFLSLPPPHSYLYKYMLTVIWIVCRFDGIFFILSVIMNMMVVSLLNP